MRRGLGDVRGHQAAEQERSTVGEEKSAVVCGEDADGLNADSERRHDEEARSQQVFLGKQTLLAFSD